MVTPRKVYCAGPMTGHPDHNFPAFRVATADLRDQGIDVVSPVEMDEAEGFDEQQATDMEAGDSRWSEFLARDLKVIAEPDVQAVVVLPGWERSRGARLEVHVARELGKSILRYPELTPVGVGQNEERIVDAETGGAKGRKHQRFELVPMQSVAQIAEVYHFGTTKGYAADNWRRGYAWSLSYGALMRHLAAFWEGEDTDPESGLSHVAHAGFHVLALLFFLAEFPEKDDRPRSQSEPRSSAQTEEH